METETDVEIAQGQANKLPAGPASGQATGQPGGQDSGQARPQATGLESAQASGHPGIQDSGPARGQPSGPASAQVYGLILYDGVCGLCNHFVQTVLNRDPDGRFQFASLQSKLGQSILTSMAKDPSRLNTIYLVKGYGQSQQQILSKARAALEIFSQLKGPIRFLKIFSFLPAWLLNIGYDFVAANRYRVFGRLDVCPMPDPALSNRFLDQ